MNFWLYTLVAVIIFFFAVDNHARKDYQGMWYQLTLLAFLTIIYLMSN